MRLIAIIPTLLMCASAILAIFCILAGYNSTFLEGFELVTLNTSLLGSSVVNEVAGNALQQVLPSGLVSSGVASSLATRTISIPTAIATYIPPEVTAAIAGKTPEELLDSVAEILNIHDFYKIHMLNYCEGYYEPGPIINATNQNPTQNLTFCSPAQAFSFFNITDVLLKESNVPLDQLQLPSEVQDAINAMAIAQKTMFVLYCVGAGLAGLAALQGILALLINGRLGAVCNSILDLLAFIMLGIASALATAFIVIVTNAINQYGAVVNVQAYRGTNFLIITWIATALALVSSILWCIDCCVGPSRGKYRRAKTEY